MSIVDAQQTRAAFAITRDGFGSILAEKQSLWVPHYESRMQRFGINTSLVPIGDTNHESADLTNVTSLGDEQVVFTYAPGARSAWDNPLTYEGPNGGVPILGPFNGVDEWLETPDAGFWNDTADGTGPNEPSYTWIMWVKVVDAVTQSLWTKTSVLNASGQDWMVYINTDQKPVIRFVDQSINAEIGRYFNTGISEAWHHLAFTKSTGVTVAAINIYLDGAVVDDTDLITNVYVAQEDGTAVVRIGAESDGGTPLTSSLAGGPNGPIFAAGVVASADAILADYQETRTLLGV